jgi:phospholipid-binding lipoprotein MlaA
MMRRNAIRAMAGLALMALGACATPTPEGELIGDPFEQTNREIHEFNVGVDQVLLRPVTVLYDNATPDLVKLLVGNAVDHIRLPLIAVNELLQGRALDALATVGRFGVNTVAGAGGLLDPATEFGLPLDDTDFGETLHVWGANEGPYVVLPLLGPATGRDAVGRGVDFVINPTFLVSPGSGSGATAITVSRIAVPIVKDRYRAFDIIDEAFYEAEDSYVTTRSLFVQNRRRALSRGEIDPETLPDIFGQ